MMVKEIEGKREGKGDMGKGEEVFVPERQTIVNGWETDMPHRQMAVNKVIAGNFVLT